MLLTFITASASAESSASLSCLTFCNARQQAILAERNSVLANPAIRCNAGIVSKRMDISSIFDFLVETSF